MPLRRDIVKRIHWPELVVEAVLVILSVLLALTLNGWRQNEFHEDLAAQALRNIEDQIRTNKTEVEGALAYHEALLDDLPEDRGRAMPSWAPSRTRAAPAMTPSWSLAGASLPSRHSTMFRHNGIRLVRTQPPHGRHTRDAHDPYA